MGSSAKEITGQALMGDAREAVKLSREGYMSEMGGKGMEAIINCRRWSLGGTQGVFGVRTAGSLPGSSTGWFEGAENVGLGVTLATLQWQEGSFGFSSATVAAGSPLPPSRFKIIIGGVGQNYAVTNGLIANDGAVSTAFQNRLRSTAPQIIQLTTR